MSFKTNTHSLLWIKLIPTVIFHIRILGLIILWVLCFVHEHNITTHQNIFMYTLEPMFSVVCIGSRHCCHAWLIYRAINPVPLKKTEYHCNYTSELHRHLSEENLNAKYPSPHPTIEINTKCYILHYNTSMSASVHCKRYILYKQCFRNQIYSHLHVTGFFTATAAILLIVSYGIKFQVLQAKIQCVKPSDQEVIHLILTMTLFLILLHFVMIGQPRDIVDRFFFKIFHHFLLVHFYCYWDGCWSVSSLISSLHLWSIIFWCVTTQRKQIFTFGFLKVLKSDLYKSIVIAIILQNFNKNCFSHFCSNVSYNFTKILSYILFYVVSSVTAHTTA